MILPDYQIAAEHEVLGIEPFNPDQVQPASYDLRLDKYFRRFVPMRSGRPHSHLVDPKDPSDRTVLHEVSDGERFGLEAQGFALASTVERVAMPDNVVGRVEGKSSLARLGLFVHVTAGFIDPGFSGHITLELYCANPSGIWLYPDMPIAQISFEMLAAAAKRPYGHGAVGSKYADQPRGPVASRYWKNFRIPVEPPVEPTPTPATIATLNGHNPPDVSKVP